MLVAWLSLRLAMVSILLPYQTLLLLGLPVGNDKKRRKEVWVFQEKQALSICNNTYKMVTPTAKPGAAW